MPYKANSELPEGVRNALPEAAQTVYRGAFNGALEGTCKGDESCAAKVAWSAVKRGWEKKGDAWVKKSLSLAEFSLHITKAYIDTATGERCWQATCSNTQEDAYRTRMSVALFKDFILRIKKHELAPAQFRSEYWSGGLPYLSVSHYEDLGGWAAGGRAVRLFIDGEYLKARGIFSDTEIGRAIYEAIAQDMDNHPERPIRISISFLDYGHKHGNIQWMRKSLADTCPLCDEGVGNIVFTHGLLVHLAVTRVPANADTSIELEGRSMTPLTRKDDAESIVGEALAEQLDEESALVGRSQVVEGEPAPALVVRSDDTEVSEEEVGQDRAKRPDVTPADKKAAEGKYGNVAYADPENKKYPIDTEEHIRAAWSYINMPKNAEKYSPEAVKAIKAKIVSAWKKVIDKAGPPAASEKKSVVEEMDMGGEMPGMSVAEVPEAPDYPMGGAVTLAEARKYYTATGQVAMIQGLWTEMEDILYNIMQRPDITDKPAAIKALLAEAETELKSVAKQQSTAVVSETSPQDPVDVAFEAFRAKVVEIRSNPQIPSSEDRLGVLQEHFVAFGEAVKKSFLQPEEPRELTVEEQVQRAIAPFVKRNEELGLQVVQLTQLINAANLASTPAPILPAAPAGPAAPAIPQRRSFQRPVVTAPVKPMGMPLEGKPRSIHEIVRGNAGLPLDG